LDPILISVIRENSLGLNCAAAPTTGRLLDSEALSTTSHQLVDPSSLFGDRPCHPVESMRWRGRIMRPDRVGRL